MRASVTGTRFELELTVQETAVLPLDDPTISIIIILYI